MSYVPAPSPIDQKGLVEYVPRELRRIANFLIPSVIWKLLNPRTAAEVTASVTPVDYSYQHGHVLRYGTNTTPGTTDMTAAFQAAINALPSTGGAIYAPAGDYAVRTVNLAGTSNNKSNVTIYGDGNASIIRQLGSARASDVPTGDTTQSPNVIYAYYNAGFKVANLRIIGNKDTGGVKPTLASNWVGSTVYTFDAGTPTYRQTRADGTAVGSGADLTTDKVWRLLVSHTSHATDIDNDVALGRWAEVTNFAALNGYYYDESFARGMCIYFGGPAGGSEVTDVTVENCRIEGAYYANVLIGSGPAKTGIVQAGCRTARVIGNYITNSSAGIGGLLRHDYEVTGNTVTQFTGNGINADEDGSKGIISANVFIGHTTAGGRNGISSYQSDNIVITGNYVAKCQVGISFQDSSSASNLAGSITGNTIDDSGRVGDAGGGTGISVGSSDHTVVTGNHIRNSIFNGIKVSDSNGVAVVGNTVYEAGAFGVNFEDCFAFSCSANNVRRSGRDNFYFEGARSGAVTGNSGIDGNTDDSATLYSGFRCGPFGATNSTNIVFTGNIASDTRAPRQQHYGLNIEAGCVDIIAQANDFGGNATSDVLDNGTSTQDFGNDASTSGSVVSGSNIRPRADATKNLGAEAQRWLGVYSNKYVLNEATSAPATLTDNASIWHATDSAIKVIHSSGLIEHITREPEATAAAIAASANSINTAHKHAGKRVWDTTNNRMLRASGAAATDPWHVVDGSATITPA